MEPTRYNSIRPGQVWLDTEGKRIQAHGGSVMYLDGAYYWYGENKEFTEANNGIWHWGVRCYKSTDLYNWEDLEGAAAGEVAYVLLRAQERRRCNEDSQC